MEDYDSLNGVGVVGSEYRNAEDHSLNTDRVRSGGYIVVAKRR